VVVVAVTLAELLPTFSFFSAAAMMVVVETVITKATAAAVFRAERNIHASFRAL
jgi:hypothetical protein